MNAPARLAAFAATLAVLFGGGALAGGAIDPTRGESRAPHTAERSEQDGAAHGAKATTHANAPTSTLTQSNDHATSEAATHPVRGLAVAENGLRLVIDKPELRRGRAEQVRFSVVDERGIIVRDFDVQHEKRMHLIIARRDLTGFQHLHPEQAADGSWTSDVTLERAGSYRLFADFAHQDQPHTLAGELRVDGRADLRPLPTPSPTSVSDGGYDVRLTANDVRPGQEAELRFAITDNGRAVHTEPYLGAGGHLVALREGDLGFLHVHPTEHGQGQSNDHDDTVGFTATFPTAGRYRLFLQFQHDGRVQTVAFTQEVE